MTKKEKRDWDKWDMYVNIFLWNLGITVEEEQGIKKRFRILKYIKKIKIKGYEN